MRKLVSLAAIGTLLLAAALSASDWSDNGNPWIQGPAVTAPDGPDSLEYFGSTATEFSSTTNRVRGNFYRCDKPSRLTEQRIYLNSPAAIDLWFVVYECTTAVGTYHLIDSIHGTQGPGLSWYSSGPISVDLDSGKCYFITAQWQTGGNSITYYRGTSAYPYPANIGALIGTCGGSWAYAPAFPPADSVSVTSSAFIDNLAYYMALETHIAPRIVWTSPAEGEVNVPVGQSFQIAFSEPMNPTWGHSSTPTLPTINGTWNAAGDTLTMDPDGNLLSNTAYTVYILAAQDMYGHPLAGSNQFSFTTGYPIYPIPFFEGIEAGVVPPTDWTQVDVVGTAGNWLAATATQGYPQHAPHTGTYQARFNSYSTSGHEETRLQSPLIDLGPTGGTLDFWFYHDTGYSGNAESLLVEVSTDGGSNWTLLGGYKRYLGSVYWENVLLDLAAYANDTVIIGFRGKSYFGNDMFIDDINVYPNTHAFGTIDTTITFTGPGNNTLAGITFCPADSNFYFVSMSDDHVYRLNPQTWAMAAAFGTDNPGGGIPWGISWDGTHFWVSHIEGATTLNKQYTFAGAYTGENFNVTGIGGSSWMGGMDFDGTYTWQTAVGGTNKLYRLDLANDVVVDSIPGVPWVTSQRGCSWIPWTSQFLSGGWNTGMIYLLDDQGVELASASLGSVADLDIYDFVNEGSEIWGLVALNTSPNTIHKVWLGIRRPATGVAGEPVAIDPKAVLSLMPNYPNPFRTGTTIEFALPKAGQASLKVYNILGQQVATLVDGNLPAGPHRASWSAKGVANGIYLYRLEANGRQVTRKLAVVK